MPCLINHAFIEISKIDNVEEKVQFLTVFIKKIVLTVGKKKKITPIYFHTNYRTAMKLVPIIMDKCLLQFDALKFFLGVRLHGGSQPNFNFFNLNPQIFQRNREVYLTNCLETN